MPIARPPRGIPPIPTSRAGRSKARKAGRLVVYGDGSINAAASDARRAEMTDPDQQRRSTRGDGGLSGPAEGSSYLKARTALTVYQAQERQLAIQKKGTLVDRARAETLVFWLARQERDVWVTWPARVSALMAVEVAAEVEKQSGKPVTIEAAIMQRVLETNAREQQGGGGVGGGCHQPAIDVSGLGQTLAPIRSGCTRCCKCRAQCRGKVADRG
ncbi:hypothetical protein GCM10011341_35480 [Frigidibacter albus]|nr:hypothetical protein GCM10011341_35480 [Frigidibacter albus]